MFDLSLYVFCCYHLDIAHTIFTRCPVLCIDVQAACFIHKCVHLCIMFLSVISILSLVSLSISVVIFHIISLFVFNIKICFTLIENLWTYTLTLSVNIQLIM